MGEAEPCEQAGIGEHDDPGDAGGGRGEHDDPVRAVAAIGVAAHEVGHAIQHEHKYVPMSFRSALFPAAAFGTNAWQILLTIGIVLLIFVQSPLGYWAILVGVVLYSFAVLFHLVTLPVEFDASKRAKVQLQQMGVVSAAEAQGVNSVLNAAAMTYLAGALAAIMQLAYYVMMLAGARD